MWHKGTCKWQLWQFELKQRQRLNINIYSQNRASHYFHGGIDIWCFNFFILWKIFECLARLVFDLFNHSIFDLFAVGIKCSEKLTKMYLNNGFVWIVTIHCRKCVEVKQEHSQHRCITFDCIVLEWSWQCVWTSKRYCLWIITWIAVLVTLIIEQIFTLCVFIIHQNKNTAIFLYYDFIFDVYWGGQGIHGWKGKLRLNVSSLRFLV